MELTTSATGGVRVIRRDLSGGAGADFLWRHAKGGAATSTPLSVGGTYVPAAGDFDGDGRSDIFWYGEWTRSDSIWTGRADGRFGGRAADQRGTFVPLAGDFDGDGLGDIYWYQPGPDPIAADPSRSGDLYEPNARNDQLWRSTGTGWTVTDLSMPWAANPVVGDFDGSGTTDILWVQPGTGADRLWRFDHDGRPTSSSVSIAGDYRPVVGDFDGNGVDDVFWYGPGARPDSIWWFDGQARYRITQQRVTGEQYRPFAGDFDGDGHDDLFWYAPGPGNDYRWSAITSAGSYRSVGTTATGIYQPVVGDYDGNGVDDIVWYS
ncbi:MAG: VCBS repeat-containing protein [Acidimicrobiales bacterium]